VINESDESDYKRDQELETLNLKAFHENVLETETDSDQSNFDVKSCHQQLLGDEDNDSESGDESDCDSASSMYQLAQNRVPFVRLNIMILMEYAEGETLREVIDSSNGYLTRNMIFNLFT
jgi:hypothetical protein